MSIRKWFIISVLEFLGGNGSNTKYDQSGIFGFRPSRGGQHLLTGNYGKRRNGKISDAKHTKSNVKNKFCLLSKKHLAATALAVAVYQPN